MKKIKAFDSPMTVKCVHDLYAWASVETDNLSTSQSVEIQKKGGNDAGLEGRGFNSMWIKTLSIPSVHLNGGRMICCQSSVCLPSPSGNKFSPHSVQTINWSERERFHLKTKTNVKKVKGNTSDKESSKAVASIYNNVRRECRLKEAWLSPCPRLDPEPFSLLTLIS